MRKLVSMIALVAGLLFASVSFASKYDNPGHDWKCQPLAPEVTNIYNQIAQETGADAAIAFNDHGYNVNGGTFSYWSPNAFYVDSPAVGQSSGAFWAYQNGKLVVKATLCADVDPGICRVIDDTFVTVNIHPDGSRVMKRIGESKLFNVETNGVLSDGAGGAPTLSVLDMDGKAGYVLVVSQ